MAIASNLATGARDVVEASDPDDKVAIALALGEAWRARTLPLVMRSTHKAMPKRPGRPDNPLLLPPRQMPKRSVRGKQGRIALLHALAHIELNAIDLAWDLIGRFATERMPRSFFDDWVKVGVEEAGHFRLINNRLAGFGARYGDLPAHDGLWEAAQETGHSLLARLAVIPLVLEARGLDITPVMIKKTLATGDLETAEILRIIYNDEKGHVGIGMRWFRFLCDRGKLDPLSEFHKLVRVHFRGQLKPPFNSMARSRAGMVAGFYRPLAQLSSDRN